MGSYIELMTTDPCVVLNSNKIINPLSKTKLEAEVNPSFRCF